MPSFLFKHVYCRFNRNSCSIRWQSVQFKWAKTPSPSGVGSLWDKRTKTLTDDGGGVQVEKATNVLDFGCHGTDGTCNNSIRDKSVKFEKATTPSGNRFAWLTVEQAINYSINWQRCTVEISIYSSIEHVLRKFKKF